MALLSLASLHAHFLVSKTFLFAKILINTSSFVANATNQHNGTVVSLLQKTEYGFCEVKQAHTQYFLYDKAYERMRKARTEVRN